MIHQHQQQQQHLQAQHQHAQHQHAQHQHQQHLQAHAQAQAQAHQARIAAESKGRDRSPIRNGGTPTEADRKDIKEEELAMLQRAGSVPPYYLSRLGPMLDPSRRSLPPHPSAYAHPGGMWPGADPYRDAAAAAAYRFDPMRGLQYNPLMSAAMQEEEQRAKLYGQYRGAVGGPVGVAGPDPMAHLRTKDPSPPGPPGPPGQPGPGGMLNNHQFHHRASMPGLPPGLAPGLPPLPAPGAPHPKMTAPTPPGGPHPGGPPGQAGGSLVVDLHNKKEEPAAQPR